jgi:serine phosphatase RsbU (regulator of sigma subunit)
MTSMAASACRCATMTIVYQTSRHAGGDYYDVIPIDANRFAVVVADVSGHGATAAIVMAMIRAVTHAYPGPIEDPSDLLSPIVRMKWMSP